MGWTFYNSSGQQLRATAMTDIGARAHHSSNQSITNNTFTVLSLNSERWDTDSIHDNSTNNSRLTCNTAGKYIITAGVYWGQDTSGERVLEIFFNGATVLTRASHPYDVRHQHFDEGKASPLFTTCLSMTTWKSESCRTRAGHSTSPLLGILVRNYPCKG